MPHWTPQKQQWVGTSRSPAAVAFQWAAGSAPAGAAEVADPGGHHRVADLAHLNPRLTVSR